jgi:hypothetical protein
MAGIKIGTSGGFNCAIAAVMMLVLGVATSSSRPIFAAELRMGALEMALCPAAPLIDARWERCAGVARPGAERSRVRLVVAALGTVLVASL